MNDVVIEKVLALFDLEDIPFIKAKKYIEYKEKEEKRYVKKIGDKNENRERKMGRILISRD